MTIQIPLERNNWIFHTGSWFPSFVSWKTYPYFWTFWLRNFQQYWSIFQCYLGICRCCIRCLSFTICNFCNYIHDFRRSHLWRRRSLLCEYSISVWVIFYNVITEFHTSLVFLKFLFSIDICSSLKQSALFLCVSVLPGWPLSCFRSLMDWLILSFRSFFFLSTIHLLQTQILTPVSWIFSNEKTLFF